MTMLTANFTPLLTVGVLFSSVLGLISWTFSALARWFFKVLRRSFSNTRILNETQTLRSQGWLPAFTLIRVCIFWRLFQRWGRYLIPQRVVLLSEGVCLLSQPVVRAGPAALLPLQLLLQGAQLLLQQLRGTTDHFSTRMHHCSHGVQRVCFSPGSPLAPSCPVWLWRLTRASQIFGAPSVTCGFPLSCTLQIWQALLLSSVQTPNVLSCD